jgi:hypothetical protein
MRIHPISGHSPESYKFLPDGNLSLENEDMSGKMRTYGSPRFMCSCRCHTWLDRVLGVRLIIPLHLSAEVKNDSPPPVLSWFGQG